MHGQAREPRQGRKAATVTTFYQCRGVPGHFLFSRAARKQSAVGSTKADAQSVLSFGVATGMVFQLHRAYSALH
jgi:hypothetical protein